MTEIETPYANINELADYFRVSVSTLRMWIRSGKIPADSYIRLGVVYRFRVADVEAALTAVSKEAQEEASKTEGG